MALHQRHKKDPFETYSIKTKKRPGHVARRKLKGFFTSSFSGGRWASVALPVLAFTLLISVFIVKIVTDSRKVSDEQFRNDNPLEIQENIARVQRNLDHTPEIETDHLTEETTGEATEQTTERQTEKEPDPTETAEEVKAPIVETLSDVPDAVVLETDPDSCEDDSCEQYLFVATSVLNLREEASTDSDVIAQLSFNERLAKLGEKDEFFKVRTGSGLTGYVHRDLVSSEESEAIVPGMDMYVQVGQAYIRSGPGTDNDIIGFGFKGTVLTVIEAGDEWSLISTETGLKGYMLNELFGTRKTERVRETVETNAIRYIDYPVVYIREKASVDSEAISTLAKDDRVVQLSTDGSWSKVETSEGLIGYVRNDMLRETAPVTPYATTNRNQYVNVSVSNIRAEASTDSTVVGKVHQDEKVLQIETDGTWSRIRTQAGVEGFVLNEYLTSVAPTPSTPPATTQPETPAETKPADPPPTSGTETPTTPAPTTPAPTTPADPFVNASGKVYVNVSAANLRAEPSTSALIVDLLRYGDELERIAANSSWTKVKTSNGQQGYISNSLIQTEAITQPDPAPPATSSKGQQIADIAYSMLGVPYVYGGASQNGVDCSGLVKYAYAKLGVNLPHGSNSQARSSGYSVSFSSSNFDASLRPGDLVFFNPYGTSASTNYSHVGIYVGNGKMIHAPQPGQVVSLVSLYGYPLPVRLAKRIFD